jgi:hypothetical protein
MKNILLIAALATLSTTAFARNCTVNSKGEVDWKTECRLDGSTYMTKQCKEVKVPGEAPGTYKYEYKPKRIGWGNTVAVDVKCDITIHECKALAEKMLNEYARTDECGQEEVMKKVKFKYSVLDEINLEFKTIHKGTVR